MKKTMLILAVMFSFVLISYTGTSTTATNTTYNHGSGY